MRIYCPNCKNTGESIKPAPGIAIYGVVLLLTILSAGGAYAGLQAMQGGNGLAAIITIALTPLSLFALGVAVHFSRKIVENDDSQRCPCCSYPWGVPHDWRKDGPPGVPPVLK